MEMGFLFDGFEIQPKLAAIIALVSLLMFVGSLVALPIIVVKIPQRYFMEDYVSQRSQPWLVVIKNLLGAILLLAGIAMLVLPGQGLLTMFVGITLMNFPGKRSLERWVISLRWIRGGVDALRRRRGHNPLEFPQ